MKALDLIAGQPWAIAESSFGSFADWASTADIDPQSLAAYDGKPIDGMEKATVRDGVATLPIRGMIFRHDTPLTRFLTTIFGGTITEALAKDFGQLNANPDVRQILLMVDSPGGHAAGVGEMAEMIHSSAKPVTAYVGSQAASAGYYLASAAKSIVVDPSAMLGSIGVVLGMSRKRANDPIEIVSSQSPHKRSDPETEAGKAQIQAIVDSMADVFISDVARFRNTSAETVASNFGKGGMKLGRAAVEAGMADHVGSYENTLDRMRRGERFARKPVPAASMAEIAPKEPAMSEPNAETISAAEAAELRNQVQQYKAEAAANAKDKADAVKARIAAEGSAFYGEMLAASKLTPGEKATAIDAFALAAQDDHDHPIPGKPNGRQDALRSVYEKRTPHTITKEVVAGDPARKGRALGMDPADEQPDTPEAAEEKELQEIEANARKWGEQRNGRK